MLKTILTVTLLTLAALSPVMAQGEAEESDRLNAQVMQLYREGKYDEALPVAKHVVELREKALGGEDLKVAYALVNLANLYARKGDYKEADPLFARALAVLEKRGAGETDLAADLDTQLGLIRVNAGKYKEGEPYLQRALDTREKAHGKESPSLVTALLNLADVNFLRHEKEQAYAFLGRALTILEQQPVRLDMPTGERLKNYYCPLMGIGAGDTKALTGQLGKVIWKLEKPDEFEKFEKWEREKKEREARGETTIVKGGVLNGKAIDKPAPSYPVAAKEKRIQGTVVVQITVDEAGKVIKAEALCGHPILAKESVESARKARFTPTLLSGMPVKVSGVITYNFVLQ